MPTYTFTISQTPKGRRDHDRHPVRQELARLRAVSLGLQVTNIGNWSGGNPRKRTWTVIDTSGTTLGQPDNPVTKLLDIFEYFEFVTVSSAPALQLDGA
jgi:hypothetical protein